MDENVYDEVIDNIREEALKVDGIKATEKCFVRKSGAKYHVDLHAIVDSEITVREGHELAHKLKDHLVAHIPDLGHVMIHIEPNECLWEAN
ncbi:ferrous iron efflux protein F [compost metagenome]